MKVDMKKILGLVCALYVSTLLTACSDKDEAYTMNSERFGQLTVQEQTFYAPTQLFRAVYMNDESLFDAQLKDSYLDFSKKNDQGDTALAVAIKLRREDFVNRLVEKATFDDLKISNMDNRSYLSLLAEYNYENAFDELGEKYILQIGPLQNVWTNFPEVDFPDVHGRRAAHYAHTASFMDKLEHYWFYGMLDFSHPWDSFYNHGDETGGNFLHSAAEHGKSEIAAWFVARHCGVFGLEDPNNWGIFQAIGFIARKTTEYFHDIEWDVVRKKHINIPNVDGNTPLHLAAKNGNARTMEFLLSCQQIDPSMRNKSLQSPMTLLLKNIDPQQPVVDDNYKNAFLMLIDQVDPLWAFLPAMTFKNIVNDLDTDGFSAIHYAARLQDPFFYEHLKKYQLPNSDAQGILPGDRHRQ